MAFIHLKPGLYVRDTELLAVLYSAANRAYTAVLRDGEHFELRDFVLPNNWKPPQWAAAGATGEERDEHRIRVDAITSFQWGVAQGMAGEAAYVTLGSPDRRFWLGQETAEAVAEALGTPNALRAKISDR